VRQVVQLVVRLAACRTTRCTTSCTTTNLQQVELMESDTIAVAANSIDSCRPERCTHSLYLAAVHRTTGHHRISRPTPRLLRVRLSAYATCFSSTYNSRISVTSVVRYRTVISYEFRPTHATNCSVTQCNCMVQRIVVFGSWGKL